jgi:hypothetical protein
MVHILHYQTCSVIALRGEFHLYEFVHLIIWKIIDTQSICTAVFPQGCISDMVSAVSRGIGYVRQNIESSGGDPNKVIFLPLQKSEFFLYVLSITRCCRMYGYL